MTMNFAPNLIRRVLQNMFTKEIINKVKFDVSFKATPKE